MAKPSIGLPERFGVCLGDDCVAECSSARSAEMIVAALNAVAERPPVVPVEPRPLLNRSELTAALDTFFDQAIDNRRIVKASIRELRHFIDAFLDDNGWKDAERIAHLVSALSATQHTLRSCGRNAADLEQKRNALSNQITEREAIESQVAVAWMKWMIRNGVGGW
jgi:hypothetical protein